MVGGLNWKAAVSLACGTSPLNRNRHQVVTLAAGPPCVAAGDWLAGLVDRSVLSRWCALPGEPVYTQLRKARAPWRGLGVNFGESWLPGSLDICARLANCRTDSKSVSSPDMAFPSTPLPDAPTCCAGSLQSTSLASRTDHDPKGRFVQNPVTSLTGALFSYLYADWVADVALSAGLRHDNACTAAGLWVNRSRRTTLYGFPMPPRGGLPADSSYRVRTSAREPHRPTARSIAQESPRRSGAARSGTTAA